MRNVYSCNIKFHALGFEKFLRKAYSASCWLWKHFPCKKLLRCLSSGSQMVREPSGKCGFHGPLSGLSSTSDGWLLIFKTLVSLQNFLNHQYTVCSLAVPGPNVLLTFWVVSAAFQHNWNSNKKIAQICLLSSIFSVV